MLKKILTLASLALCGPVFGQSLEPGEWEFLSSSTSPISPKPQTATFTQCVKKEDADNPERWMGRQSEKNDCKFTPGEKSGDTVKWEMSCAKSNMRGSGSARLRGATMESEMQVTGEVKGRRFQINTKMTGKRLGPCKS